MRLASSFHRVPIGRPIVRLFIAFTFSRQGTRKETRTNAVNKYLGKEE